MGEGKFWVHSDRWEAKNIAADALLAAREGRVHSRKLARLIGTVISIKLTWGPVTQLYSRHLYDLINFVLSPN